MEQQHQLKQHGNFSLVEQNMMTAEDRAWHIRRLEREMKERQEAENKAASGIRRPSMPRRR